jgi:hypothetical protein
MHTYYAVGADCGIPAYDLLVLLSGLAF